MARQHRLHKLLDPRSGGRQRKEEVRAYRLHHQVYNALNIAVLHGLLADERPRAALRGSKSCPPAYRPPSLGSRTTPRPPAPGPTSSPCHRSPRPESSPSPSAYATNAALTHAQQVQCTAQARHFDSPLAQERLRQRRSVTQKNRRPPAARPGAAAAGSPWPTHWGTSPPTASRSRSAKRSVPRWTTPGLAEAAVTPSSVDSLPRCSSRNTKLAAYRCVVSPSKATSRCARTLSSSEGSSLKSDSGRSTVLPGIDVEIAAYVHVGQRTLLEAGRQRRRAGHGGVPAGRECKRGQPRQQQGDASENGDSNGHVTGWVDGVFRLGSRASSPPGRP